MFLKERMEEFTFSPSEKAIVDYILTHLMKIEELTTTKIAQETFTSKSLLIRIAHKLGFTGWSDLKQALIKEHHYLLQHTDRIDANLPFTKEDNIVTIASNIATIKHEAIAETLSLNHYSTLQKAIRILNQANHCHVFALANNILLANEFEYNMHRIEKATTVYSLQGEGLFGSIRAKSTDCAIIISYSGETEYLVRIMKQLQERNVPVILITNIGDSTLAKLADPVLRISTQEKLFSKISTFANDASIAYLLDVLYAGVFANHYDSNLQLRHDQSLIVETARSTNSTLLR